MMRVVVANLKIKKFHEVSYRIEYDQIITLGEKQSIYPKMTLRMWDIAKWGLNISKRRILIEQGSGFLIFKSEHMAQKFMNKYLIPNMIICNLMNKDYIFKLGE